MGYVGLVVGACLADAGRDVMCADVDESRIEALKHGRVTVCEPGLESIVGHNLQEGRLQFTSDAAEVESTANALQTVQWISGKIRVSVHVSN